jgi:type VI secretion system ImpH/TssG family protein
MLSTKCKIEEYDPFDLTFEELIKLVKFTELFHSDAATPRVIQFKTYLDNLVSHNGLFQIKHHRALNIQTSYRYTVFSSILTLLGPKGVLPAHYTERAISLIKDNDRTMVDFLDIFYNKLMYSLYRILKGRDVALSFQIYALGKKLPYHVRQVGSFIGIQYEQETQNISSLLRYSGAVAMHSRSISTLQSIIAHFVAEPVLITQFVLVKMPLPKDEAVQLGRKNCSFQPSFYCGSNIYLYQNKINILIKELFLAKYKKLIFQKRDKDSVLNKLIATYLGRGIAYSLEMRVKRQEKATKWGVALGIDMWCSNCTTLASSS